MKGTLCLTVLLLMLVWSTEASENRVHRGTILRRTSLKRMNTLTVAGEDNDSIASSTGGVSASNLESYHETMQGDQKADSSRGGRGPHRRVIPSRRVSQPKNPTSQVGSGTSQVNSKPVTEGAQSTPIRMPSRAGSLNVLATFAGKNRVLVISAPHDSDSYYQLMVSLLKSDVYCEMAERHMQQIIMFHQEGEMAGKVRRVTSRGQIMEETLDSAIIPRLMNFLKMEEGKFGMVLLRKTLQVEERYPYPVRLEAMYEVMDQTPMRKLEKARQRGFVQRCKATGVEGQVVESQGAVATGSNAQMNATVKRVPVIKEIERKAQAYTQTTKAMTASTSTRRPTITRPTTTTTTRPTTTSPITWSTATTTNPTTTITATSAPFNSQKLFDSQTATRRNPAPATTDDSYYALSMNNGRDQPTPKPTTNLISAAHSITESIGGYGEQYIDSTDSQKAGTPPTELSYDNPNKGGDELGKNGAERSIDTDAEVEITSPKKGKVRQDNAEKNKKVDKSIKRNKADKRKSNAAKDGDGIYRGGKSGKKGAMPTHQEENGEESSSVKQPDSMGPLASFFGSFERRQRLLVITAPSEENRMFTQQRDEYLEQICEMAVRKISIVTILGTLTNGSMKIDHYQLEHDQPLKDIQEEVLTNQLLIKALRKDLGLTFNDYYMVLTDFDMKVKQEYEVPIAMKAVFDFIDTFTSRIKEMEQQRKQGVMCKKEDTSRSLENFLSRFRWRRRLFVISSPDGEEWAYQQQLYTLTSQACNLGLRHLSVLKLVGKDMDDMGGVLELYPINGSATVDREDLSASLVKDVRNYFQISTEYFSMLLVGKDGNVKSWYPSPMWSMSIMYDLVDSMQLRRQEMAIQQSLGMRCPEDEYDHHRDPDSYHRGYGY